MKKFKVGDRVVSLPDVYWHKDWPEATVTEITADGTVKIRHDDGRTGHAEPGYWEPKYADELTQLRAFKEAALASGYVPAEPDKPETDEEAAERLQEEYWDDKLKRPADVALAAFAWARANPPIDKP